MTPEELQNRFTYHAAEEPEQVQVFKGTREMALRFAEWIVFQVPDSRERSTALTKLDEVVMHANAATARHWPATVLTPTPTTEVPDGQAQ